MGRRGGKAGKAGKAAGKLGKLGKGLGKDDLGSFIWMETIRGTGC